MKLLLAIVLLFVAAPAFADGQMTTSVPVTAPPAGKDVAAELRQRLETLRRLCALSPAPPEAATYLDWDGTCKSIHDRDQKFAK